MKVFDVTDEGMKLLGRLSCYVPGRDRTYTTDDAMSESIEGERIKISMEGLELEIKGAAHAGIFCQRDCIKSVVAKITLGYDLRFGYRTLVVI